MSVHPGALEDLHRPARPGVDVRGREEVRQQVDRVAAHVDAHLPGAGVAVRLDGAAAEEAVVGVEGADRGVVAGLGPGLQLGVGRHGLAQRVADVRLGALGGARAARRILGRTLRDVPRVVVHPGLDDQEAEHQEDRGQHGVLHRAGPPLPIGAQPGQATGQPAARHPDSPVAQPVGMSWMIMFLPAFTLAQITVPMAIAAATVMPAITAHSTADAPRSLRRRTGSSRTCTDAMSSDTATNTGPASLPASPLNTLIPTSWSTSPEQADVALTLRHPAIHWRRCYKLQDMP